ncbi:MAG: hypothetical protein M1839_003616 [Geoglossum umbratile]|nr:MAG: hypothetical protein M1839_003616 [Geoglossum umbratile]
MTASSEVPPWKPDVVVSEGLKAGWPPEVPRVSVLIASIVADCLSSSESKPAHQLITPGLTNGGSGHIREIEGLFAGVGLLNELEPLLDEDFVPDLHDVPPARRTPEPNPWGSPATDPPHFARFYRWGDCWRLSDGTMVKVFAGTDYEHVLCARCWSHDCYTCELFFFVDHSETIRQFISTLGPIDSKHVRCDLGHNSPLADSAIPANEQALLGHFRDHHVYIDTRYVYQAPSTDGFHWEDVISAPDSYLQSQLADAFLREYRSKQGWLEERLQLSEIKPGGIIATNQHQFEAIRVLRRVFNTTHRKFLRLTKDHQEEGVRRFRAKCRDPVELLDIGILNFREIQYGLVPSTHKEVFASVCLASAMSRTMELQGKLRYLFDTSDLSVWTDAVAPDDRWIVQSVVDMLWPENMGDPTVLNQYLSLIYGPKTNLQEAVGEILESSNDTFQFSELTHLQGGRFIPRRNGLYHCDYDLGGPLVQSSGQCYSDPSRHGGKWGSSNPRSPREKIQINKDPLLGTHTPGADALKATSLFLCVICFLSAIGQLGVLILTLSGIQYDCLSEPAIPENGSHHRLASARYLEAVKFRVLNDLRLDHSFEKYIPVCKVVDKILEAGWLGTIRDVENYIITAAKVCSLGMVRHSMTLTYLVQCVQATPAEFLAFVSRVLELCSKASPSIPRERVYRRDHSERDSYTEEYLQRRRAEAEGWINEPNKQYSALTMQSVSPDSASSQNVGPFTLDHTQTTFSTPQYSRQATRPTVVSPKMLILLGT